MTDGGYKLDDLYTAVTTRLLYRKHFLISKDDHKENPFS